MMNTIDSTHYAELEKALHPKLLAAIRMINYMSENLNTICYMPNGQFKFDLPFPDGSYIGMINEGGIGFTSIAEQVSFGMSPENDPSFRVTDLQNIDCVWTEDDKPGVVGLVQFPYDPEALVPVGKGPTYVYFVVKGDGQLGSALELFENLLVELYAKIVASQLGER